jgi:hypothetical protein
MYLELSKFAIRCMYASGMVLALSLPALASPPENRGTSNAPGLNRELLPDTANPTPNRKHNVDADDDDDDDDDDGSSGGDVGRPVVLSGLSLLSPQSFLRLSNLGADAGAAQVTLFDAESGDEVASWDSGSIPAHGALQVSLGDIAGDVELDEDATYNAEVTATFNGQVQHVSWSATDGTVSDLTACRRMTIPKGGLGYVSGPGSTILEGLVRIVNEGNRARSITLVLHSAASGEPLGAWTSPEIEGHGALEISVDDLSAEATAPVPEATPALTVSVDGSAPRLTLGYLESIGGETAADLSAGCPLRGSAGDGDDESDDNDD